MAITDLAETFRKKMRQLGADLSQCEGAVWMDATLARRPDMTIAEFVAEIDRKIGEGTANHGWLITGLSVCWADLSEDQRLHYIAALVKGGAHKVLLSRRQFNVSFTDRERAAIRAGLATGKTRATI